MYSFFVTFKKRLKKRLLQWLAQPWRIAWFIIISLISQLLR